MMEVLTPIQRISMDCFYEKDQSPKDVTNELYRLLLKKCNSVIEAILRRKIISLNLKVYKKIDENQGTMVQVYDTKTFVEYCQNIASPSDADKKVFYDVIHGQFKGKWDQIEEQKLMNELMLEYESYSSRMKGDIAKMLSKTKNERVKYMRKTISNMVPEFHITIMRVDDTVPYDRNRRKKDIFYTREIENYAHNKASSLHVYMIYYSLTLIKILHLLW